MLEKLLIENGCATLANLKTASLFTVPVQNAEDRKTVLARWRSILEERGVSLEVLRDTGKSLLVYVYREKKLARDLLDHTAQCILCRGGYPCRTTREALDCLKCRLAANGEFPHEIGLFLGYPPEDVQGFIENRGQNCKCTGCWKVYGDRQQAEAAFARFKKCREVYLRLFDSGRSLSKLTVAS